MLKLFSSALQDFTEGQIPGKGTGKHINSRYSASKSEMGPFIANCSRDYPAKPFQAISKGKVTHESLVHSDCWTGSDGHDKHFRINKSRLLRKISPHPFKIGIEAFWSYTNRSWHSLMVRTKF